MVSVTFEASRAGETSEVASASILDGKLGLRLLTTTAEMRRTRFGLRRGPTFQAAPTDLLPGEARPLHRPGFLFHAESAMKLLLTILILLVLVSFALAARNHCYWHGIANVADWTACLIEF